MTQTNSVSTPKYGWGQHPNSRKNLKIGGIEGNGNLAGSNLVSLLKYSLNKPLVTPKQDALARELLVHSTIEGAILREPTPFREVWDRVEGKVTQPISGNINFCWADLVKQAKNDGINSKPDR